MSQRVINDKNQLDEAIKGISALLKNLNECEEQLKRVMNDLNNNWNDDNYSKDRKAFNKFYNDLVSKKENINKTLSSTKVISGKIQDYLSK